jgi:hypothetical protein
VHLPWPPTRLASLLGLTLGLTGVGWGGGSSAHAAEDGDRVRLAMPVAGLPFSSADLESAVQTRLALVRDGGPATEVTVTPTPTPGNVMVISARRLEEISVAGKSADEAARLVALAIVAVVRPPTTGDATAFTDNGSSANVPGLAARATGAAPASGSFSLAAATGIAFGLVEGAATSESMIEGGWSWGRADGAGRRPWQLALGVGFARARVAWNDRAIGGTPAGGFDLDTFPVRLGLRRRWGFLVAGAGPVLRLFRTSGFDSGSGAVAGGYASLGADMALGRGFRATATASCDLDSERLVFRAAGQPVLTAGPVIAWLGLGLAWGTP